MRRALAGVLTFALVLGAACGKEVRPRESCLLLPDTLPFGDVYLGRSYTAPLTIVNADPNWIGIAVREESPEVTVTRPDSVMALELAPGDSFQVQVTFKPQTVGKKAIPIEILGLNCGDVRVTGTAQDPSCISTPGEIDLGPLPGAGTTLIRTFTVRNDDIKPVTIDPQPICSEVTLVAGAGERVLTPGDSLEVIVEYRSVGRGDVDCGVDLGPRACGVIPVKTSGHRSWQIKADGTGDAPTVQAGIDSASDGDVVWVEPGRYYENIDLKGKAIHLVSAGGPDVTILDGSHRDDTVVKCHSGESNDTVIEGLMITGGSGWTPPWSEYSKIGGGVQCLGGAPTIRGNIITRNQALDTPPGGNSRGGGIGFGAANPSLPPILIEGNIIEDNYCSANSGGINIDGPCIIQDNVIRGNATGKGDGGGLYQLGTRGKVIIRRNRIVGNHAADHGGGLYIVSNTRADLVEVSENVILWNRASGVGGAYDRSGGGVYLEDEAVVSRNTIAWNQAIALHGATPCGGFAVDWSSAATRIERNIIYGNDNGGLVGGPDAKCAVADNIVYGNTLANIHKEPGASLTLIGNLPLDPLFCDSTQTSTGAVAQESPALNSSIGTIGAISTPGCSFNEPRVSIRREEEKKEMR